MFPNIFINDRTIRIEGKHSLEILASQFVDDGVYYKVPKYFGIGPTGKKSDELWVMSLKTFGQVKDYLLEEMK